MRVFGLGAILALVVATAADAENFQGRTSAGRQATVRTGPNGKVNRVKIVFRATCSDSGPVPGFTKFVPPLRHTSKSEFADGGKFRSRISRGFHAVSHSHVRGHLTKGGWVGEFRDRFEVIHHGQVINRCHTGTLRFATHAVK